MMKSKVLISVLFLVGNFTNVFGAQSSLDQRVSELSQQIATKMSAKQKTTIAVLEFEDLRGQVTDFGRYLAEELITRLSDKERFKVIERQQLSRLISEQKLSLTGVLEPTAARRLGRLVGADAICSGTVSDLAQSLKVNARLISTETGEVFASASTEIFKDESVMRLLTGGGTAPSANSSSPSTGAEKSLSEKIDANGLTFELKSVRRIGGAIVCELTVTSNELDREFQVDACEICHPSTMTDDSGNHHRVAMFRLANKPSDYSLTSMLVAGVPVKLTLRFESVSPDASKIALLNVNFWLSHSTLTAQFRNVAITK